MITPNMLRVGRVNKRSLDGPIKLPKNRMEILNRVEEVYEAWFKIWRETLVPELMFQQKWFQSDKDLVIGDLVYFRKTDSALDGKWIVGKVSEVERGRDQKIRMVDVKYWNSGEDHDRITSRTVRQLIKLWSIEDQHIADDLAELDRRFKTQDNEDIMGGVDKNDNAVQTDEPDAEDNIGGRMVDGPAKNTRSKKKINHYCTSHMFVPHLGVLADVDMELGVVLAVDMRLTMELSERDVLEKTDAFEDWMMSVGIQI